SALAPPTSLFSGASGLKTGVWSANVAINQLMPWGGGNYTVGFDSSRTTSNSLLNTLNPALSARVQFGISQPLLRDFHIDAVRANLEVAKRNREIADTGLLEIGASVAASAQRGYWALVATRALVDVQQRSLDLALELERTNRARVDVGQSPPLDLVAARAEVAQRREALIVARTTTRQAEDVLRTLIVDPARADFWSVQLQPADLVPPVGEALNVEAAVTNTLANRTDIVRARKQIENAETAVQLSKSDTLPDLRLQANYLTDGAGGTRLIREGGFPGVITGSESTGYGGLLGQVFSFDYPTWTVGVTFSYPLGKSLAEANLARARVEKDQQMARLRAIELSAVREVRDAALRVEQNQQRIETTRLGSELAAQRLEAEQKRFDVGMSTSFLVIQAQRDLVIARNNELQAALDYQLALVQFQAVQQVSGGR
ncbi:MAG TPA: TolC family protein, partial [Vicinamibacterales bacterium]